MDKAKIHINHFFLEGNNSFKRLPIGTFHLLHNYVMTKYDLHETSLSIPVDTIRGGAKNGTTVLKPGPLAIAYKIEPIILGENEKYSIGQEDWSQSVMSINELFIDRDELAHLIDQVIHDME